MPLESPILDVFISNHTNRRETKKASPNRRYLISFISLLSSLTKEIRHSVDSINLCVHNYIGINLSALDVGMSHEFANREEVTACRKGEDGKCMSACVKGYILLNSCCIAPFVYDSITLS